MEHSEESEFVRHLPCTACGSSDANAEYTDGHTYCFSCGHYEGADGETKLGKKSVPKNLITGGETRGLRARKITDATVRHFGVTHGKYKGQTVLVSPYYNTSGELVAQKLRTPDKKFIWLGDVKQKDVLPFGAHCWPRKGRKLVVTEGEVDALAMSQAQKNKWPTVSIPTGAGPQVRKYFAEHRDYFTGWDEVVLMFDSDAPGRDAAEQAARILGSRAKIATLPMKDASEMVEADRVDELIQAMWGAKAYRPDGIVDMGSLREIAKEKPQRGVDWAYPELTEITFGKRRGELITIGAGTGTGKTDFLTQDMVSMVTLGHKIGVFSMEQQPRETTLRMVGKKVERMLHRPDQWDPDLYDRGFDELNPAGKVFLWDNFGVNEWEAVYSHIEYLKEIEGIDYFYVDHLTAFVSDAEDERRELDAIMGEIGSAVKRLDINMILVSHLATPHGTPHEEGGHVAQRHFRGSRAIAQWSHYMIGLERNQVAEDPIERNTMRVNVIKDRPFGRTNLDFHLRFDSETGVMYSSGPPETASVFENELDDGSDDGQEVSNF